MMGEVAEIPIPVDLSAYADKQASILNLTEANESERLPLQSHEDIRFFLSVFGARRESTSVLAPLLTAVDLDWNFRTADAGSPLGSFRDAKTRINPASAVASLAAADDVAGLGPALLLIPNVNRLVIDIAELPAGVFMRRSRCHVLDVAAGAGAVDAVKYLMTFHEAEATAETLLMAVSSGNCELIRLVWDAVPDLVRRTRYGPMKTAAEWHRLEPLAWLYGDAGDWEREPLIEFALKNQLADALVAALSHGPVPLSRSARYLTRGWQPASALPFADWPRWSIELSPNWIELSLDGWPGTLAGEYAGYLIDWLALTSDSTGQDGGDEGDAAVADPRSAILLCTGGEITNYWEINGYIDAIRHRRRTLFIAESLDGNAVFGAFVTFAWLDSERGEHREWGDSAEPDTFAFTLKSHLGTSPTRLALRDVSLSCPLGMCQSEGSWGEAANISFGDFVMHSDWCVEHESGVVFEDPFQTAGTIWCGNGGNRLRLGRWEFWQL
jgi:hypothetical protein